jgi:hypothetical protein
MIRNFFNKFLNLFRHTVKRVETTGSALHEYPTPQQVFAKARQRRIKPKQERPCKAMRLIRTRQGLSTGNGSGDY